MAVTKADLVEHLFEESGLNNREAKDLVDRFFEEIRRTWSAARRSSCPDSATSNCARRKNPRGAIRRPVRRSRSLPAGSCPPIRAKSSTRRCKAVRDISNRAPQLRAPAKGLPALTHVMPRSLLRTRSGPFSH